MSKNLLLAFLFLHACVPQKITAANREEEPLAALQRAVITNYANILRAQYEDAWKLSLRMRTNIDSFLRNPSAAGLTSARESWIACREPYSQSEIGRFYDGPIEPLEEYINAWPIDLNFIDYTEGMPNSGIINETNRFPQIVPGVLIGANQEEEEGEKAVSTGFHAIEFLLWGQDLYSDSPGRRPYTDYMDAATGPGRNAARRRQYLLVVAQLLSDQLLQVASEWMPNNQTNYRARFISAAPEASLEKIFTGVGNLSSSELAGERMLVPYTTRSQENEQCCFSDTTQLDLVRNQLGVQDVFLGRTKRADGSEIKGPGLLSLLERADAKLADTLKQQLEESLSAIRAI
ncbi:MAG TPA: imelysin family protein, partial [Verrucomicrobiae bacterium]|nr:imelysin family protein [Verrucomicrobiae bacterium]